MSFFNNNANKYTDIHSNDLSDHASIANKMDDSDGYDSDGYDSDGYNEITNYKLLNLCYIIVYFLCSCCIVVFIINNQYLTLEVTQKTAPLKVTLNPTTKVEQFEYSTVCSFNYNTMGRSTVVYTYDGYCGYDGYCEYRKIKLNGMGKVLSKNNNRSKIYLFYSDQIEIHMPGYSIESRGFYENGRLIVGKLNIYNIWYHGHFSNDTLNGLGKVTFDYDGSRIISAGYYKNNYLQKGLFKVGNQTHIKEY